MLFVRQHLVASVLVLAVILLSFMIGNNSLLIPLVFGGIGLLFVLNSLKASLVLVLIASTLNGLDFASPLLKPENSSIFLCLGAIFLFIIVKRGKLFFSSEIAYFVVFMTFAYYVSSQYSPVFDQSINGMIQIAIAFTGLFVMLQARNFDREGQLKLIKIYVLISVLQTLYGIVSFAVYRVNGSDLGGLMFGQGAESVTVKGTFKEANLFGAFVGIGLLLCLVLLVNKMVRHVKLWYLASLLLFVGLVLSWTRSAWIGFTAALILMAVYRYRTFLKPRTFAYFLLSLLLIVTPVLFFIQSQFDRASGESGLFLSKITNLFDSEGGTGAYRIEQFNQALVDVQGHELLGKGYFSIKVFGPDAWISNMYLFIYHDTGIIGCVLFFSILLSIILKGVVALIRTKDHQRKSMIAALLAGVLFYVFTFNFTPSHTLSTFWIHLGLLLAVAGNSEEKVNEQGRI